jgi:hypothetical protein
VVKELLLLKPSVAAFAQHELTQQRGYRPL